MDYLNIIVVMMIIIPPHRAAGQEVHLDAGASPGLRHPGSEQQQQRSEKHIFLQSLR